MQVTQEEATFKPVVIRLDTQEEVDWICSLLGHVGGTGKVRDYFDSLYYAMRDMTSPEEIDIFKEGGRLTVK